MPDAKKDLKVLVVGGGGREHAIAWKLAQSGKVARIFCAPGNGGTACEAKTSNVDIGVMDFPKLAEFAKKEKVDLVVVGPDDPIADGAVDYFEAQGLQAFGPSKKAAQLEASKVFAKEFMVEHHIPTARYLVFDNLQQAVDAVREHPWARVIKADGLALGKGVFVCDDADEACSALHAIFRERRFGDAGRKVLLEERLNGEELSLLMFCDGKRLVTMPASRDHKRRFDGDRGPNTGGMGAYSPVDLYKHCESAIEEQVLEPLRKVLQSRQFEYKGVLYMGLMIQIKHDDQGKSLYQPYVLEFNARFGDPETQAILPLLKSDLSDIFLACCDGTLAQLDLEWSKEASCCVVAAAETYPESGSRGEAITLGKLPADTFVFQAGTSGQCGKLITNGGRVLSVVGVAPGLEAAAERAYAGLTRVSFSGMAYRKDIARRATSACL
ncbi:MAG TPA: phosphoribosylamine--glycine ligase [Candidatus Obscuribacterales bacterium]